ncbi:hypothetical protein J7E49_21800 [Variovorax paradoxus]|nr:hypothetical protein [Variovorax paradoxus]
MKTEMEEFRSMVALNLGDLKSCHGEELMAWLREFVRDQLVGIELPAIDTPENFAEAIKALADNKRAWSQRLGNLVLDLVDSQNSSEKEEATDQLRKFSETCPWQFLRQSAANKID